MSEAFLTQEEIDALLKQAVPQETIGESPDARASLSAMELDVLGEVGNISMGTAATVLSQLLNRKVVITTPRTRIVKLVELYESFTVPCVMVRVNFTSGLQGANLFIIKETDARIIASLMMGQEVVSSGDETGELTELEMSAVAEAMNQMMGAAATSMTEMFGRSIVISPPRVESVNGQNNQFIQDEQPVAVVAFQMQIDNLVDSEIMQIIPLEVASEEVELLLNPSAEQSSSTSPEGVRAPAIPPGQREELTDATLPFGVIAPLREGGTPTQPLVMENPTGPSGSPENWPVQPLDYRNLDLILDVPLRVSVVLGRSRRQIQEVLKFSPGAIVELERLVDEPVDVLVNGVLVAQGEVVVVNENFGVRITSILSPRERLERLREESLRQ